MNNLHVSIDVVVFALIDNVLHFLVGKRHDKTEDGKWALPGGSVDPSRDHSVDAAALRVMNQKTHWVPSYMEQLQTFGDGTRDERGFTVSVVYLTVCSNLDSNWSAGANLDVLRWVPVADWEKLDYAFDHKDILAIALKRLQNKVAYSSLAAHFLPEEFTLAALQNIYEILMGTTLDKSTFRKHVKNAEMVEAVEGKMLKGANRPAQLYRVKRGLVIYPKTFS